jgi:hypothetical protein
MLIAGVWIVIFIGILRLFFRVILRYFQYRIYKERSMGHCEQYQDLGAQYTREEVPQFSSEDYTPLL